MNKIKLLALDLDGTTLTSKNTLAPAVKSALEKAIANGIIIAIATGRPLGTMPQSILDIEKGLVELRLKAEVAKDKEKKELKRQIKNAEESVEAMKIARKSLLKFKSSFAEGLSLVP